jgi:hypothetical protein
VRSIERNSAAGTVGRAVDTDASFSLITTTEQLRAVARAQLSPAQRELFDLNYLDATAAGFALNPVTTMALAARSADDVGAPLVTFYAQTTESSPTPIDLPRLRDWLDPNDHRYEPVPGNLFVPPGTRRGISDGVLAMAPPDAGLYLRFLVVRRAGTVELGPACAWQWREGKEPWVVDSIKLVAQVAQLLRFLIRLGADFQRKGGWRLLINIRGAQGAILGHFAEGWAAPFDFPGETTFCLEPHVQLEVTFPGTEDAIDACIREAATRPRTRFRLLEAARLQPAHRCA